MIFGLMELSKDCGGLFDCGYFEKGQLGGIQEH